MLQGCTAERGEVNRGSAWSVGGRCVVRAGQQTCSQKCHMSYTWAGECVPCGLGLGAASVFLRHILLAILEDSVSLDSLNSADLVGGYFWHIVTQVVGFFLKGCHGAFGCRVG